MELILKENVQGLGFKNEIVTVKDGYGRNFLIPTGKAVLATASAKKELAETLKQQAHKLEKIKNDAIALAEKINAVEGIKIATKVSATGAIYGSVTNLHIAEELAKLTSQGCTRCGCFRGCCRRSLIQTGANHTQQAVPPLGARLCFFVALLPPDFSPHALLHNPLLRRHKLPRLASTTQCR